MEFERLRASASVAHAIVPPPASVASITPVASATPAASVPSIIQPVSVTPVASVTPTASLASVIQPVSVIPAASVTLPVAPRVSLVPISTTQSQPQAESSGQVGGPKTQKRIEFKETDCRLVFRKALLCKTFAPQDEYADLNTVLYSFREVIRRELVPILAEHPGVKAWIGLTNLYDTTTKVSIESYQLRQPHYTLGQRLASLLS